MFDLKARNTVSNWRLTVRVVLTIAATIAIFAALLFIPAGRLNWRIGWMYLALILVYITLNWVCLLRWNPELIERRMRFGKGTKAWDKVWAALYTPITIAVYAIAGWEARDGMSSLPAAMWPLGLVVFILGAGMLTRSMVENPFFEKTVRIQTEQGQRVIDTGPYAVVRHPGYLGFAGWTVAIPFLLLSAWAIVPTVAALLGIAVRTALEDRTLKAELPGYRDYADRVRYRLIPGIW